MLDTLRAEVQVPRSAWGGGPRPRALTAVAVHPYVEVHHDVYDAGLSPKEHAKRIEAQHTGQGWNGAFYNLGLARDGGVWELRGVGWRSIGAHATYYADGTRVDPRALTVVLFGNYEHVDVTGAQRATLDRLRRRMPDQRLRWHQMRASTACPGSRTIPVLRSINDGGSAPEEDDVAYTDLDRIRDQGVEAMVRNLYRAMADADGKIPEAFHSVLRAVLNTQHHTLANAEDVDDQTDRLVAIAATLNSLVVDLADGTGGEMDEAAMRAFLVKLLVGGEA